MKKIIGRVTVWFFLAITLNLFVLAKEYGGQEIKISWVILSQLLSLIGTTLLSLSFVLSSRTKFVEDWFGGLDKVYKLHHLLGGYSFILLLHHPLFLVVNSLPNIAISRKYIWFSEMLPYNWGVISLYALFLMLLLTFLVNLPYSLWKKTHELMGVSLIFASLHILTISSDVSRYLPLRFWMIILLFIAGASVIYRRFLYGIFGPKYHYLINNIFRLGDVLVIDLSPISKRMNYRAGQFVFVRFEGMGDEAHPFSIATDESNGNIRLAVKILGDYTLNMKSLKQGQSAVLWGPYGKFYEGALNKKDLIWVAGGIGVTPFLSLMTSSIVSDSQRKVDFIYCVNQSEEAIFDEEIMEKSLANPNISYWKYCSNAEGRINAKKIIEKVGGVINKKIMICGPINMMESLASQFRSHGVKNRDIIFEDFNFK